MPGGPAILPGGICMAIRSYVFALDSAGLTTVATRWVRFSLGLSGVATLVMGVLVVVWPVHSATALAVLLGVYWGITGVGHLLVGLFGKERGVRSRLLDIPLGILMIIAGALVVSRPARSAVTLAVLLGILLGVLWIFEGVTAIVESGDAPSRPWAYVVGLVGIVAGGIVLSSPLWGAVALFWFAGFSLIVLGAVQIVRAIRFGRGTTTGDHQEERSGGHRDGVQTA